MESLGDNDLKYESAFIFYVNIGLHFFIHMTKGRTYASKILEGENPISYAEFLKLQKIRDILMKSKERYELLKDDTDLPYESAGYYIDCMLDECSFMMMIYLSKPIAIQDLCLHMDFRDAVNKDDYNKLFLPEVPPEDRQDIIEFQKTSDERISLFYGQILVNIEMGYWCT